MKRILMINHTGLLGGAGISLNEIAHGISEDYEVFILTTTIPSDLKCFLVSQGHKVIEFPYRIGKIPFYSGSGRLLRLANLFHLLNIIPTFFRLKSVIEEVNPDIIASNSIVTSWISILGRHFDTKTICFVRETKRKLFFINKVYKYLLAKFNLVLYLTKFDNTSYGVSGNGNVIHDFSTVSRFRLDISKKNAVTDFGLDPTRRYIGFLGGVNTLKGIDIIVKSLESIDQNVDFIVAGPPLDMSSRDKFHKKIHRLLEKSNNMERIHFIGIQTDINNVFAASEFIVFPMKKPHQARPAFEIGFHSKTIIISDFENIHEIVSESTGLRFTPNDVKSFSSKVTQLLRNEELKVRLGASNYSNSIENHTAEGEIQKLKKYIEQI